MPSHAPCGMSSLWHAHAGKGVPCASSPPNAGRHTVGCVQRSGCRCRPVSHRGFRRAAARDCIEDSLEGVPSYGSAFGRCADYVGRHEAEGRAGPVHVMIEHNSLEHGPGASATVVRVRRATHSLRSASSTYKVDRVRHASTRASMEIVPALDSDRGARCWVSGPTQRSPSQSLGHGTLSTHSGQRHSRLEQ